MIYLAGIDGGQSSTVAVVADQTGKVLGRGLAGPADETGEGVGSTRLRDALVAALSAAARDAGLPVDVRYAAVVAGISGYEKAPRGILPAFPADSFLPMHDAPIAHAGAFGGEGGAVAIAGTGSVVYAVDGAGEPRTLGGWGHAFGDEGSGFTIARDALAALMHDEDAGTAASPERAAALDFFATDSLRSLIHAFYGGSIDRRTIAAFASDVMTMARFELIVERGARRLGGLARSAARSLPPSERRVACVGGLFANPRYRALVLEEIAGGGGVQVTQPRFDPPSGALLLAFRAAGLTDVELHQA